MKAGTAQEERLHPVAGQPPEEPTKVIREMADHLAAAEDARRQLLAERDMFLDKCRQLDAELARLSGRMTALDADRQELRHALTAAEHGRRDAERAAETFRDRAAQAMTAHAQVREDLIATRVREAALAERIKSRKALPDAEGHDSLRPDPLSAGTPAELIDVLRKYRTWAGNPSYRDMALRSGRRAGASTMCGVLGGSDLPDRLEVIDAIVEGCGGTDEDRRRFATAWRKLIIPAPATARPSAPRLHAVHAGYTETLTG